MRIQHLITGGRCNLCQGPWKLDQATTQVGIVRYNTCPTCDKGPPPRWTAPPPSHAFWKPHGR